MATLSEAWVNIGANTAPLTAGLTRAEGKVAKATMQMQARLKTLGTAMTIVGAIGTAAFALTVKSAIKFEKELAQVSTMLDKSSMNMMPKYKQALLGMSAAFGESTDTLANGLYDILSASIDSSKALDVLEEAAKAAVAGITDTGVAADAITTILNSYGLEAEDAGKVSDQLFGIVKRGKTTFAELAPAIGKVAATAAKSGLSFEELGASIATITRAGIRTDEAMTAVNGILRAFLKPTDDAKRVAAEFGLTLDTNTLKTEGLIGAMNKLKDATTEQIAQMFPNIRGLKGVISAMGDLTGYTKDYELLLNSAGLTQAAFEKQTATTAFKLEQLKKTFGVISVQIGDVLIPIVSDLIVRVGKVVTKISEWISANKPLVETIVKLGAALSVFTMAGGILILMSLYVKQLKIALIGMSETITMLTSKMATFRTVSVITSKTIAQGKVSILSILGPIGLFVIAVTGIVLGLKKWEEHSKKVRGENEKLKASLMGIEEINDRVKIVEARIKELRSQFELIGESAFLGGDLAKKQIEALEVELRALIGTGKVVNEVSEETAKMYREYYGAMAKATYGIGQMTGEMILLNEKLKNMKKELSTMVVGSQQWQLLSQGIEEVKQSILNLRQEINEASPAMGTIVTTVQGLAAEMELLTKEHEAYGKSIEDNVKYYDKIIGKLGAVEIILQMELDLLEEGTEAYNEKKGEIADNTKALNDMQEALDKLIKPLEGLDLIAAKLALLGDTVGEMPIKLGYLREAAVLLKQALDEAIPDSIPWKEAALAYKENQDAIDALIESFGEYGEKGKELLASLVELTDKQKKLQEAIDVVGVDKTSSAYQRLKIEYNANEIAIGSLIVQINNLEREQKEAEQSAKDLADAYKTITDKIYELTHTPLENAIYKLDQQKEEYLKLGVAIKDVNKWYDLQIAKLHELNPELDETTKKLEESGKAAENVGVLGGKGWDNLTIKIKEATVSLSNFSKEGVASAVATIRMHFKPMIDSLINDVNNMTGIFRAIAEANLAELRQTMAEQIAVIKYGYQEYMNILGQMQGGGSIGNVLGSFQHGGVVPKTGPYLLHKDEIVTPASQNTYNNSNSFSPTVNLSVQGGGDSKQIAGEVESVLYDMGRQFKRRGFEIIPGRG